MYSWNVFVKKIVFLYRPGTLLVLQTVQGYTFHSILSPKAGIHLLGWASQSVSREDLAKHICSQILLKLGLLSLVMSPNHPYFVLNIWAFIWCQKFFKAFSWAFFSWAMSPTHPSFVLDINVLWRKKCMDLLSWARSPYHPSFVLEINVLWRKLCLALLSSVMSPNHPVFPIRSVSISRHPLQSVFIATNPLQSATIRPHLSLSIIAVHHHSRHHHSCPMTMVM